MEWLHRRFDDLAACSDNLTDELRSRVERAISEPSEMAK